MLAKTPGVTFVASLALTLGIGANTAIFTLAKALLLSPLPYPEPDRLVFVMRQHRERPVPTVSVLKLDAWTRNASSFDAVTGFDAIGSGYNIAGSGRADGAHFVFACGRRFFRTLGVQPALGRGFRSDELAHGGAKAVVISHGLSLRLFGRDPGVVGRQIRMNAASWQVIGVMPQAFRAAPAA